MLPWSSRLASSNSRQLIYKALQIRSASAKPNAHRPRERPRGAFWPRLSKPPFNPPTRWLIYAAALLTSQYVFVRYVYTCDATYGISMLPTLSSFGDWVFISKWYRKGRGIVVGDLVSFRHPVDHNKFAIKRVIGMPGDFVLRDTPGKNELMIQVPQGHCWVVGDNLDHSRDSRLWGPLPLALITGKVTAKMYGTKSWWRFSRIHSVLQPSDIDELD